MNIHEYQAKQLLKSFGVLVPNGYPAFSAEEAKENAKKLRKGVYVVKAQIHAGGRGKAGGVKIVKSLDEVYSEAKEMLGKVLVTHQTGSEGKEINRVYIEEGSNIKKEYYLSLIMDRDNSCITIIASQEGGMEIEKIASTNPEKIIKLHIDPVTAIMPFHVRKLAFALGFSKELSSKFSGFIKSLYQAFIASDASQLEINPLVETEEGELVALDAKLNFDDNALYRHPEIAKLRDETEEDKLELRASKHSLAYIKMDGNIGCMVNGAGLAMATMDIIKLCNGSPANFLDVGGGATKERVTEAFKIILADSKVEGVLVNIFGGIMKCDVIANGIIAAAKEIDLKIPLVVRLEGTNVDLGKEILSKSGLAIIPANDLADAAQKIVKAVQG